MSKTYWPNRPNKPTPKVEVTRPPPAFSANTISTRGRGRLGYNPEVREAVLRAACAASNGGGPEEVPVDRIAAKIDVPLQVIVYVLKEELDELTGRLGARVEYVVAQGKKKAHLRIGRAS